MKAAIARRPVVVFVALITVLCAAIGVASSLERANDVAEPIAGLAALLCCWALSSGERSRSRPLARLAITVAAAAATVALYAVHMLVVWWMLGDQPSSLTEAVRPSTADYPLWLAALVAGLALSGVVSPSDEVRRSARRLVSWPPRNVPLLAVVALAAPALLAGGAIIIERLSPTQGGGVLPDWFSPASLVTSFVFGLLLYLPGIYAWYGFAATRLMRHVSPLLAGLLVGAANAVGGVFIALADAYRSQFWPSGWATDLALDVCYSLALALICVWLMQRARGSLVAVVLFTGAATAAGQVAYWWGGSTFEAASRVGDLYAGLLAALATLLVLAGRMWRRQSDMTQVGEAASPAGSPLAEPT